MTSPKVTCTAEISRLSFDKDILQGASIPRLSRHDSTATTGSSRPVPFGHWTIPISGNCPRCHHHHRSLKVHIKGLNDSSRLTDVHCERCNKLWLGPGTRNSTRVSLASNETLDPPPMESEARTTLLHMIRFANRVATLSPTLPIVPETIAGPSHRPVIRSSNRSEVSEPTIRVVEQACLIASGTTQSSPGNASMVSSSERVFKTNAYSIGTSRSPQSSQIISRLRSKLGTPLAPLARVRKLLRERFPNSTECQDQPHHNQLYQDLRLASATAISQNADALSVTEQNPNQPSLEKELKDTNDGTSPAAATEGSSFLYGVGQEDVNAMRAEQRIAFLRSQITVINAQYARFPASSLRWSNHDNAEHPVHSLATIHDTQLTGIGDRFGDFGRNGPAPTRHSLSISETRSSEAATAVEGQVLLPPGLFREALHRGVRVLEQQHPVPAPLDEESWDSIRRDRGDIR